jgi:uncharacterized protein
MGGHLGWFELGGGRWFAKAVGVFLQIRKQSFNASQAADILSKTAQEIDFDVLKRDAFNCNGEAEPTIEKAIFDPMRRRMHIAC